VKCCSESYQVELTYGYQKLKPLLVVYSSLTSVLYSIQVYWSNIFVLPKKIIRSIEQKFNRFLCNESEVCCAKAKFVCDLLCVPKREGGLGLKRIEDWNKVALSKHIWNLYTK
jgi:hypothetical protein